MIVKDHVTILTAALALAVALTACSSGSSGPSTGQLSLSVSDGPVHDAIEVCLEFDEIEVKKANSPPETITGLALQQVNLLEFQGPNSAPLLMDVTVEAGEYQWIRLGVNATKGGSGGMGSPSTESVGCSYGGSYVIFADEPNTPYNAYVPSGSETGLKVNSEFIVAQGGLTSMTADFDLQKTLTEPPGLDGDIVVRPSVRLLNDLEVGTVVGTVSADLAEAEGCSPSIFVFDDGDEVMDPANSIASGIVSDDDSPGVYSYAIGFLYAGEDGLGMPYDVAFSCDGGATFSTDAGTGDITIVAGETETLDFPVPGT